MTHLKKFAIMLSVEQLHFSYSSKKILRNISLSISQGEIVSLIGLSGSGKTTLFKLITGLISPEEGSVVINGEHLPKGNSQVTFMRQEDLLLPWRTVLGNLVLFNELGKSKSISLKDKALSLLERVGLKNCQDLYPHQLSGGMRQRVSLARSLLQEKPLLLLDEPFGSLDVIIREQLYTLLREIRLQFQKTLLLVTHDFRDAIALSDRILVLSSGTITSEFFIGCENRKDPYYIDQTIKKIKADLMNSI